MSKQLYLANVGRTIFMNCSNSQVIGMADTLTQATFNLTVQEEELRGGPGNPLLASTFHDQSMELSFTDALISTDMIGAMIGATDTNTGKTAGEGMWMKTETVAVTSSAAAAVTGTLATTAPTYGNVSTNPYVCYYRKEGSTDWVIGKMDKSTKKFSAADSQTTLTDGNYCVKYFAMNASGSNTNDVSFNLNADFVPSVLHAISYIDVYEAGNAGCSGGTGTSTGRAVGQLVIDIPLFQLNNGLNLQLSTTPGTYDISGKALATETAACTGNARTFGKIYYVKTAA